MGFSLSPNELREGNRFCPARPRPTPTLRATGHFPADRVVFSALILLSAGCSRRAGLPGIAQRACRPVTARVPGVSQPGKLHAPALAGNTLRHILPETGIAGPFREPLYHLAHKPEIADHRIRSITCPFTCSPTNPLAAVFARSGSVTRTMLPVQAVQVPAARGTGEPTLIPEETTCAPADAPFSGPPLRRRKRPAAARQPIAGALPGSSDRNPR